MRVIKFRAFSEKRDGTYMVHYSDPIFPYIFWQNMNKGIYDRGPDIFIGLTDDDNQPIYEGDIVLIKINRDDLETIKCEVIYEDASFLLYDYKGTKAYRLSVPFSVRVIGNIHENRGLINERD